MDIQALIQALTNTLDHNLREQAEALLDEVHRLPDFSPCLLQIVMNEGVPLPSRQAGAVYLKNCVFKYWKPHDSNDVGDELPPYSIPEQAKSLIRDNIVGAIIHTPLLISRQLCVCLEQILKNDFPKRWTAVVGQVHAFLSSDNQATWLGSLMSLYQLSKKYKFKKAEDRVEYIQAMKTLLPLIYQRTMAILPDHSLSSVTLQHHILKIFYATMQHTLPLDLIDDSSLPGWIIVFQTVVQRPVPKEAMDAEVDDRPQLEWWKCKKWALHILCRLFERFGNPGNVEKCYSVFAAYYVKTFNAGVINVLLRQLAVKQQGEYVSPRVIQGIFNYFIEAVDHAASWKLIRPHFQAIFQDLVFPMMCYSDEDDQLWHSDPYEYIRLKFDIFEDLVSPLVAAQHFLTRACAKRKNVLDPVMVFCVQTLSLPPEQRDPRRKDGALHVIGSMAEVLMKKKLYKSQLESMLVTHVFPEFQSELGYMRARACWMLHYFSEVTYSEQANLQFGLQQVFTCLIQDKELPVKVEAAVALQFLIKHQSIAESFIQPYVKPIIQELLVVIRETENDDLTSVMQELIETYAEQIGDVAVSLCASLVEMFNEIVDPSGQNDDDSYKALTALGILSAVQSLVKATFNEKQIMQQMEATLINTVATMLQNGVIDFYEEMLALLDLFTTVSVSPQMWQMLFIIYETFTRDGFDYFTEMMSVLYNFVKVDTDTFLSNPKHIEIVISMCKAILSGDPGEDSQVHACKLLEVTVLQCQGRIDPYIPNITEAALGRLTRESKTPELRTMCLQVNKRVVLKLTTDSSLGRYSRWSTVSELEWALDLQQAMLRRVGIRDQPMWTRLKPQYMVIAALFYNPSMLIELLEKTHFPESPEAITSQFLSQWVKDADLFMGIHDRKISVLGFCSLLQCPVRPAPVLSLASKVVPAIISQLESLVDAYKLLAEEVEDEEEEEDDEGDIDEEEGKELDSEEDDVDNEGQEYLKLLAKKAAKAAGGDDADGDSDSSEEMAQTLIEIDYETVIDDEDVVDEFCVFRIMLEELAATNQEWYAVLTSGLSPEQTEKIQQLFVTAEQKKAARESRKIELAGGYEFNVTQVPHTFIFSSPT